MSDFIYSRKAFAPGRLSEELQRIYHHDKPEVWEYHGKWGSLAVSRNLYNGFQPFETTDLIFVVLGGPVLCFQENTFLTENDAVAGSRAIYKLWRTGEIKWDEDLSGPYIILIIDKNTGGTTCVTDMMSFIPVYSYEGAGNIMMATHVDVLARASGQYHNPDVISEIDFTLHGVVTFPFTCYSNLRQLAPAAVHSHTGLETVLNHSPYWLPEEKDQYDSIGQAARELRKSLLNFINAVTHEMDHIAHFISGGEDSRSLAGMLPSQCRRDAFVFLERMNREGKIAKKAAETYGAVFHIAERSQTHYLNIIPAGTDLLGSGSVYRHAHAYGFVKDCALDKYHAVFGALYADTLLKGSHIKKIRQYGFLPQVKDNSYSQDNPVKNTLFAAEALAEVTKRRQAHLRYVRTFRKESSEEWFDLWPCSMNKTTPNIYANRRLFRSYEPFTANPVVKISACVPQKWKLNRRLFQRTARPFLKKTKWLPHGDGRLPYFPWYINKIIAGPTKLYRKIKHLTGAAKSYQGPWFDWNVLLESAEWENRISDYAGGIKEIEPLMTERDLNKIFHYRFLDETQQLNLLQQLYLNHVRAKTTAE